MHVVGRHAELLEVPPHRRTRNPRLAQRPDRRAGRALRKLLAVGAEDQAVVDELRR